MKVSIKATKLCIRLVRYSREMKVALPIFGMLSIATWKTAAPVNSMVTDRETRSPEEGCRIPPRTLTYVMQRRGTIILQTYTLQQSTVIICVTAVCIVPLCACVHR